jgi:excisionase family DNA binding protein
MTMMAPRNMIELDALRGRVSVRPREFSALTGTPLPSVYRYIATKQIPATRIGSTWLIPVSAILGLAGSAE